MRKTIKKAARRRKVPRPRRASPVEVALAAFAHEVRTPLTGILALNELIATADLPERERRWADAARSAAEHLGHLTSLIVDGVRAHERGLTLRLAPFRLRGFCASSGELRREVHAVGVPMRRTVDGEIVAFNCTVPAFMVKKGQLEEDLGPRLVAMVRNVEAALGLH